ncbi:enolase C-terminal domain-like protein [Paracraurococcus lichenis]|uniref:Enolase C-terminal domain-like protein n=1 Tax=Paracraurococcus lichenis TaxID=3064888 RepID=A0ABT9DVS5_9PROT|nr:enolase C-terminal domain-like protein [Paracraurococcus sp. LOR1-02]MDO9708004.1 enolase C-terminal domain-like protein [Paracraurococcus sp. LOR1-02]
MLPSLTIQEVAVRAVDAPLDPPLRNSLNVIPRAPLVIAEVRTREGVAGHAYVFPYTPVALGATAALVRNIGAGLAGRALAPATLWAELHNSFRILGTEGLVQIALSCLDMAMWDALGRAAGQPLCRLLGAEPRAVPIYASLRGWGAAMLAEEAGQAVAALGAGAVKFKLGQPRLEDDLDTVRAVREAVGPGVDILVDYNQGLTRPEAERRGLALEALDVRWLEEPLPVDDDAGLAALRGALRLPVQGGENWWAPKGMARALAAGAVDLCMPDAMKIGGVTGWQQAAALAAAHRVPMSSHIFVEASAQLLPATPTAHLLEHLDVAGPLLRNPLEVRDGMGLVPERPGLGLHWEDAALARWAADV